MGAETHTVHGSAARYVARAVELWSRRAAPETACPAGGGAVGVWGDWAAATALPIGSVRLGLEGPTSDVDMVVLASRDVPRALVTGAADGRPPQAVPDGPVAGPVARACPPDPAGGGGPHTLAAFLRAHNNRPAVFRDDAPAALPRQRLYHEFLDVETVPATRAPLLRFRLGPTRSLEPRGEAVHLLPPALQTRDELAFELQCAHLVGWQAVPVWPPPSVGGPPICGAPESLHRSLEEAVADPRGVDALRDSGAGSPQALAQSVRALLALQAAARLSAAVAATGHRRATATLDARVRAWARARGLYGGLLGRVPGMAWTVMVLALLRAHLADGTADNADGDEWFRRFVDRYREWDWERDPVDVDPVLTSGAPDPGAKGAGRGRALQWWHPGGGPADADAAPMTVLLPAHLPQNLTAGTLPSVREALRRALRDPARPEAANAPDESPWELVLTANALRRGGTADGGQHDEEDPDGRDRVLDWTRRVEVAARDLLQRLRARPAPPGPGGGGGAGPAPRLRCVPERPGDGGVPPGAARAFLRRGRRLRAAGLGHRPGVHAAGPHATHGRGRGPRPRAVPRRARARPGPAQGPRRGAGHARAHLPRVPAEGHGARPAHRTHDAALDSTGRRPGPHRTAAEPGVAGPVVDRGRGRDQWGGRVPRWGVGEPVGGTVATHAHDDGARTARGTPGRVGARRSRRRCRAGPVAPGARRPARGGCRRAAGAGARLGPPG